MHIVVDGRSIKAVAQLSKQGFCYVFDRETGEPVWPIEERPVPQEPALPGERPSPTQPFPTKPAPYAGQGSADDQLIDFTPQLRAEAIELLKDFARGPIFTPPTLNVPNGHRGMIQRPSDGGSTNWNGGALDPETGLLYVPSRNNFRVTRYYAPVPRDGLTVDYTHGGRGPSPRGPQGLPIFKPPYSRMTAINLNTGDHEWMKPAGMGSDQIRNHPALEGLDLPPLGGEGRGGPLVTKTLMISAKSPVRGTTSGEGPALVAYDKATGEEVGEVPLPGRAIGTPMTYMLDGKQFIALTVSGRIPRLVAYTLQ